MSVYFNDLEALLTQIESATTYYQVLGIERGDDQEKIKASYQNLLSLLYPPYVVSRSIPSDVNSRVERAFTKTSQAFAALASFVRRSAYDRALLSIASKPPAVPAQRKLPQTQRPQPKAVAPITANSSSVADETYDLSIQGSPESGGEVYMEVERINIGSNRRRCERFKLTIPARISGYEKTGGKWSEMTETIDVSRTGARLRLRRRVRHGTVLFLTLPLPSKLRGHGYAEQSYNVYTLVRRVEHQKHGVCAIGVEFLGEHPPKGFLEKPWAIFRARRWGGQDRRRPNRIEHAETVRLEYFDENLNTIAKEQARTENVGHTGLRIVGTAAPTEFDFVRVTCPRLGFQSEAELRNRYMGKDGKERLCVKLLEREWPTRG